MGRIRTIKPRRTLVAAGDPALDTEPLVCEHCGRPCATFIPKRGDGSWRRVAAHYTEKVPRNATWAYRRGRRCPGRWAKGWGPHG